ncbi:S-ribosylhomocysteine lyase [Facklamia sp. 7083-14-GEN3]|uniref:S-ribosylhomocysteine lyase n=1 Tax=Facklamia sp. 7083-14-GEN3 TaxID=2973478 RepID=UPI00215CD796|nr:S-ribosylhomocysteine lyase [Facklamia sp. 7083-14-GEN3]MCR8969246.1 S-ribosylhomocysteine lyase [Facklamia sp. 7083-14-GEN3]
MEKIPSFTINHLNLKPGVYLSRTDEIGGRKIHTYDLRFTAPNAEPVMNTAEIHTIEHLAATFLRNHEKYKNEVIYFGPMGCRTGFYLILTDALEGQEVLSIIKETFKFTANFEGEIPGATARDCGNYLDQNLPMAKYQANRYLKNLEKVTDLSFTYPE